MKKLNYLKLFALTLLLGITAQAADEVIRQDKLKIGKPASGSDKVIELDTGSGSNAQVTSDSSQRLKLRANTIRAGRGTATNITHEFDIGNGATNPKFRWNNSTSKIEFSNDGSTYSEVGANTANIDASNEITNLGLASSVGSNALTIALKGKDGNDPSGSNIVKIGFRSSTLTTGTYNQRTATAATSVVVSSGSTLGHVSAVEKFIYVYAIDNAGTVELAVSSSPHYDNGSLVTTTAEGGAGAADSPTAIYSTTARTNVPIRLIGRLRSSQTTAGTWASAMTEASVLPFKESPWVVDVNIVGANPSLGTSAVTSYTGISDSALSMTLRSHSDQSVQIPCSSTNASTGLTCSSGNEMVGVVFTPPNSDWIYEICGEFAWEGNVGSSGSIRSIFQWIETSNTSQTIVQEGGARVENGIDAGSASGGHGAVYPNMVCSSFKFSTTATRTIRLMYEQSVGNTIFTSRLKADQDSNNGQRDIRVRVKAIK